VGKSLTGLVLNKAQNRSVAAKGALTSPFRFYFQSIGLFVGIVWWQLCRDRQKHFDFAGNHWRSTNIKPCKQAGLVEATIQLAMEIKNWDANYSPHLKLNQNERHCH